MRLRSFKAVLAGLLMLVVGNLSAKTLSMEYIDPTTDIPVQVILEDTPCTNVKVKFYTEQVEGVKKNTKWQSGKALIGKENHVLNFCWTSAANFDGGDIQHIVIIDENADGGFLSIDKFAPISSRKDYL